MQLTAEMCFVVLILAAACASSTSQAEVRCPCRISLVLTLPDSRTCRYAGFLLEQAQWAAIGLAQQSGQLRHARPLHQGTQRAICLPLPGIMAQSSPMLLNACQVQLYGFLVYTLSPHL